MLALRAAVAAALVAMAPAQASAHAKMTASTPADGATVAAGLSQIEMRFSHPMRLTLLRVHRAGSDKDVPLQDALPKAFAATASVSVAALPAGAYDVSWIAVSQDGHVMQGHFAFAIAPAGNAAPAQ